MKNPDPASLAKPPPAALVFPSVDSDESVQLRFPPPGSPLNILFLPGLHGDATLVGPFRRALGGRARLLEATYPQRKDWVLTDYAHAVEEQSVTHHAQKVWVLAESFSSQVAWTMIERVLDGASPLRIEGLILAGGFVRHPWPWGVHLAHGASCAVPRWLLNRLCRWYGRSVCRAKSGDVEILGEMAEFVRRRAASGDRPAITSRYPLIAQADLRSVARRAAVPVFHLSGAIDPIVPWWIVRPWLEKHCPGFRGSRIVPRTVHNVLLGAPAESASQILEWIEAETDVAPSVRSEM
ncbi:MAG: hypothetical protein QOF48_3916 [Verrucomicrobiota bacterium]|jgi:pimeloyl-ACP methyl ester carboxylesterase